VINGCKKAYGSVTNEALHSSLTECGIHMTSKICLNETCNKICRKQCLQIPYSKGAWNKYMEFKPCCINLSEGILLGRSKNTTGWKRMGYIVSFSSMLTKLSCWEKLQIRKKSFATHSRDQPISEHRNSLNVIHIPCSCLLYTSVIFSHFTKLVFVLQHVSATYCNHQQGATIL